MSRKRSGQGVIDGDPVAIILLLYMFFVLIFWFQSTSSLNPFSTNSTIRAAYTTGYNGIRWLALMLAPFAIFLVVKGFTGEGSVFHKGREEEEDEE